MRKAPEIRGLTHLNFFPFAHLHIYAFAHLFPLQGVRG
jgi:hypothetical protein